MHPSLDTNHTRRRLLGMGGATLFALWIGQVAGGAAPHSATHGVPDADPDDAALTRAAIGLLERRYVRQGRTAVHGPVSLLQREFFLGFRRATELAERLAGHGMWQIMPHTSGASATLNHLKFSTGHAAGANHLIVARMEPALASPIS